MNPELRLFGQPAVSVVDVDTLSVIVANVYKII